MGGQLNFSRGMRPARVGMLMDLLALQGGDIITRIAAADIGFGVAVEFKSDGTVQPVQDTHANWPPPAATPFAGVTIYDPVAVEMNYTRFAVPPSGAGTSVVGYLKGMAVPILRRGRMWMAFDGGGTLVKFGTPNLWHSSDGTNLQGVATFSAIVTTAGAEIEAAPTGLTVWDPEGLSGSYTDAFNVTTKMLGVSLNLG